MTPNQPDNKTMMDCIDSIEEKLTLIMDHLGIQPPEEPMEEVPGEEPMSMKDKITSSSEE